jgi:hypothetical protein
VKSKSASPTIRCNPPILISLVLLCAMAISARATTILVTNTDDSGPGSLRQALADANDSDTINFDPSIYGQTITLTSAELVIDKSITISGPGANSLTVSGGSQFLVFHVTPQHTVTIEGLTVSDGDGGIYNDHGTLTVSNCIVRDNEGDYGAGIYNDASQGSATLMVLNSIITNNCACRDYGPFGAGGGIAGDGEVTIVNTTVSNNFAVTFPDVVGSGGGIISGGILTITDSTITGNIAASFGGGIISDTVIITNSTISGNTAGGQFGFDSRPGDGGGIYAVGTLTISNSTITSNNAYEFKGGGSGGGIYTAATLILRNSTVSDNWALNGGGLYNTGSLEIGTTILKRGFTGSNIFNSGGLITSHGYNLSDDDGGGYLNGPGDQINTDPLLGPLQNNGGPTSTHALLPGSPAIDAGDPGFSPPPWYDQRGPDFWRVRNDRVDIGSFEVQNGPALTPTPTPTPRPFPTPRSRPTPPPRPTPR